jgi:3-(3-hydroxy-phenyl)propionate hydroxylase
MAPDVDVVVVGFGPVGVTLSGMLARRGVRVLAIERDTDIFPLPRAAHLDAEVMRILQDLGCADRVAPALTANKGMDFLTADRQVLLSMRSGTGPTRSGWSPSSFFHQPGLEVPMREAAVAHGAEVRLGTEVASITDHGDHVLVELQDGSSVSASFLVGCDGARSTVRRQLGVTMHDLQFEEPWLVLDLLLHEGTPEPTDVAFQMCDPARPHTVVPMPPPRFRFEFMLLPGEDPTHISSESVVRSLLSAWVDPDGVTVERSAVYTFHGLIARDWRVGRVMLAGDSAHQMPPFLGQGMCSGMRDAANLAWKLAAVVHGTSPLELLDTYQTEREPHVRAIVESAVNFGRLICTTDAAAAAERDRNMLAARAAGGGNVGGNGGHALAEGVLVAAGGRTALQPMVGGTRLDDLIGPGFAVLLRTPQHADHDGLSFWQRLGAKVFDAESTPEIGEVLDSAAADAAVVRPDRYVAWVGERLTVPGEAAAALLTR